jgi:quinohemoprotein ethanol dehydrogenase
MGMSYAARARHAGWAKKRAHQGGVAWRRLGAGIACSVLLALCACSRPSGDDWTGYGGDHSNAHYSPLAEITADNVNELGLAWFYDIDTLPTSNSTPVAHDGVLYFSAGYSVIHALDAATGALLWKHDTGATAQAGERMRGGWGVRGIAYHEGKIFTGTIDGRLVALNARDGREVWSVVTVEEGDGRYISGPPWVFNDTVLIGHGGADFQPVRGYVTAYDTETGAQKWRFYTVPGNPAGGFENEAMRMAAATWTGEWWRFGGGGTVWNAMAYDARYHRIYLGVGNGAPWNQKIRSPGGGDNLFLASIVALDADTGAYQWHYQVNPAETWDFNANMDIQLADLEIDGRERHVILHAPKNGFFYVIDREDGALISTGQFAQNVTWASRIDQATGRPVEYPQARFPNGQAVVVFPSPTGAHAAEASAFSPQTRLVYIPAIEQGRIYVDPPSLTDWRYTEGQVINNAIGPPPASLIVPPGSNRLLAWDPILQREVWSAPQPGLKSGGVLATAGNLVFQGNAADRFTAFAADSGREVWSFDTQTGILANPISYRADGRQFVAVMTGWRSAPGPGLDQNYSTQRRRILAFARGGDAVLPPIDRTPPDLVDLEAFRVDATRAQRGGALYGLRCFLCHGSNLVAGGTAPDLRRSPIPLDLANMRAVLHDGALLENGMPVYPELSDADIGALQHYIRQQARAAIASEARVQPDVR